MDIDHARAFLRDHPHSILAVIRSAGRPQMSPVLQAVGDDGRVMISSRETAYKVINLRRDPRASLCVISDGFFGGWVQIDGPAEIVSLPDAMELLVDQYRRLQGEHPDWDQFRQAMVSEQRCMILVTIERAGPDRRG